MRSERFTDPRVRKFSSITVKIIAVSDDIEMFDTSAAVPSSMDELGRSSSVSISVGWMELMTVS